MARKRARENDTEAVAATQKKKQVKKSKETGSCLTWGQNSCGQLGFTFEVDQIKRPRKVQKGSLETRVISAVAGGMHTAAVTADGKVLTFGCNDDFALGRICVETDEVPKDEAEATPGFVEGLEKVCVQALSAGDSHTFALTDDGCVYGTGVFRDGSGSFAFSENCMMAKTFVKIYPPPVPEDGVDYPPATAIASGSNHIILLAEDEAGKNTLFTYGIGDQGQLGRLAPKKSSRDALFRDSSAAENLSSEFAEEIKKAKSSPAAARALLKFHPITKTPWGKDKIVSIGAGGWSSYVVTSKGKLYSFGLNNRGQLGRKPSRGSLQENYPVLANLVKIPVKSVAAGDHHAILLAIDGAVYSLGSGETGQLGLLSETDTSKPLDEAKTPQEISSLKDKNVVGVSGASSVSYAICKDGSAYSWGFGENLQLGGADEEDRLQPELIKSKDLAEGTRVVQITAGGQHACCLAI
eukprot:m.78774 g.78774  ORF g.78774 m.78774 type:complete len:467 (+) comp12689_c0_seq3:168-1568(+)